MARNKYDAAWYEHLLGCNACNYDKQCMACEVGEAYSQHACNCKHGPEDNGYHLFQKTTLGLRMVRQHEQFELGQRRADLLTTIEHKLEQYVPADPIDWFHTLMRELFSDTVLDLLKDPDVRTAMGELIEISDKIAKLDAQAEKQLRERATDGEVPF